MSVNHLRVKHLMQTRINDEGAIINKLLLSGKLLVANKIYMYQVLAAPACQ